MRGSVDGVLQRRQGGCEPVVRRRARARCARPVAPSRSPSFARSRLSRRPHPLPFFSSPWPRRLGSRLHRRRKPVLIYLLHLQQQQQNSSRCWLAHSVHTLYSSRPHDGNLAGWPFLYGMRAEGRRTPLICRYYVRRRLRKTLASLHSASRALSAPLGCSGIEFVATCFFFIHS